MSGAMAMALRVPRRVDGALVAPGPARTFRLVSTGLAAVIGFRLIGRRWWEMASLPGDLFQPAFVVAWMPAIPSGPALVALQVLGVAAAVVAGLGRRAARPAFALAWVSLLLLGGLWSSVGKVMHNEVLLLTACLPFLVAPWPARDRRGQSGSWGWPPRASLALIASVYAIAGIQKLVHSGPAWVLSDNISWVLYDGATSTRSPFPELAQALAEKVWAAPLIAGGALAVELSAPLLLSLRRTRLAFVALATSLHAGIWMTLGLDYSAWVLTVAAVAIPMALRHSTAAAVTTMDDDGGP